MRYFVNVFGLGFGDVYSAAASETVSPGRPGAPRGESAAERVHACKDAYSHTRALRNKLFRLGLSDRPELARVCALQVLFAVGEFL